MVFSDTGAKTILEKARGPPVLSTCPQGHEDSEAPADVSRPSGSVPHTTSGTNAINNVLLNINAAINAATTRFPRFI